MKLRPLALLFAAALTSLGACAPRSSGADDPGFDNGDGGMSLPGAECDAKQTRCSGLVYQTCSAGKYVNNKTCATPNTCDDTLGCVACRPGRLTCAGDELHNVNGVFNGLKLRSAFSDAQFFSGRGAGATPTASAVLSDLSALRYGYKYEYKKLNKPPVLCKPEEEYLDLFIAHSPQEEQALYPLLQEVHSSYRTPREAYSLARVRLDKLRDLEGRGVMLIKGLESNSLV